MVRYVPIHYQPHCMTIPTDPKDDIIRSALTMLTDLEKGYPWRELHMRLPALVQQAREAGVDLSEVVDPMDQAIVDNGGRFTL